MSEENLKRVLWKFPAPLVVAVAYLMLGFLRDMWHPSWMLFLLIPIYYMYVASYFAKGMRKKLNNFPAPLICVCAYLLLGFIHDLWHPGWLIFLLIPLYYWTANAFFGNEAPKGS